MKQSDQIFITYMRLNQAETLYRKSDYENAINDGCNEERAEYMKISNQGGVTIAFRTIDTGIQFSYYAIPIDKNFCRRHGRDAAIGRLLGSRKGIQKTMEIDFSPEQVAAFKINEVSEMVRQQAADMIMNRDSAGIYGELQHFPMYGNSYLIEVSDSDDDCFPASDEDNLVMGNI